MVGHTGNLKSAVAAVESVDKYIGEVSQAALSAGAVLIVTADHGNCEVMLDPKTGQVNTDHTTNPVPCLFVANEFKFQSPAKKRVHFLAAQIPEGIICDIAPTVLEFFGLDKPGEMTGTGLVKLLAGKI